MDFDEFFRRESDGLVRMCWLLTLDRDAAADVAQESMARAWARWGELTEPGSNPAGWVRTVATNLARSRWRRLRTASRALPKGRAGPAASVVSDPALLAAIHKLSPRQREAVILRYWIDLKLDDCAEAMGVSVGAVSQHLARAHDRLAELVDRSETEELTL